MTSTQRAALDGRRGLPFYDDRMGCIELHRDVFEHASWRAVREQRPDIYADCRAVWLTCLQIWAKKYDTTRQWDGRLTQVGLRRALPDCAPELDVLIQFGVMHAEPPEQVSMPYFPTKKGRSSSRGVAVYKIDLTQRHAPQFY